CLPQAGLGFPPPAQSLRRPERSEGRRKTGRGAAVERTYPLEKYQQLSHRHGAAFVRHVLASFQQQTLTSAQAAAQLGLSRSRFYTVSTAALRATTHSPATL